MYITIYEKIRIIQQDKYYFYKQFIIKLTIQFILYPILLEY